jgi:hypothetical protein
MSLLDTSGTSFWSFEYPYCIEGFHNRSYCVHLSCYEQEKPAFHFLSIPMITHRTYIQVTQHARPLTNSPWVNFASRFKTQSTTPPSTTYPSTDYQQEPSKVFSTYHWSSTDIFQYSVFDFGQF